MDSKRLCTKRITLGTTPSDNKRERESWTCIKMILRVSTCPIGLYHVSMRDGEFVGTINIRCSSNALEL